MKRKLNNQLGLCNSDTSAIAKDSNRSFSADSFWKADKSHSFWHKIIVGVTDKCLIERLREIRESGSRKVSSNTNNGEFAGLRSVLDHDAINFAQDLDTRGSCDRARLTFLGKWSVISAPICVTELPNLARLSNCSRGSLFLPFFHVLRASLHAGHFLYLLGIYERAPLFSGECCLGWALFFLHSVSAVRAVVSQF